MWRYRFGFVLAVAFISAGAAHARCVNLPGSDLKVYTLTTRAKIEGAEAPQPRSEDPTRLGGAHPELVITTFVSGHVTIERTVVARDESFCAVPKEVLIGIGPVQRVIQLPRGFDQDTCTFEALVEHAYRHALAEDRAIDRYVSGTEALFGSLLGELKRRAAPTAEAAYESFSASVRLLVDETTREVDHARRLASERVDTPDILGELGRQCGGSLHEVVRGAGAI